MFGAGGLSLIAATQVNAALLRRFEPRTLLLYSSATGSVASLVLVVLAATATGGVLGVVIPVWGGDAIAMAVAVAGAQVLALVALLAVVWHHSPVNQRTDGQHLLTYATRLARFKSTYVDLTQEMGP